MKFNQLYSGSAGNLYTVTASTGQRLLIDPGVTWRKLQAALDYHLSGIVGCLVSHEHADHSKAAKEVLQAGIDVYSSHETFEALNLMEERRIKFLVEGVWTTIGDFEVLPFEVHHDSVNPFGFIVRNIKDKESLLFCTDTSHLLHKFRTPFDIVAIECSYNREYLQKRINDGTIHETVAKRLLLSHMEEKETLRTLKNFVNLEKCQEIHLIHCSADNINKERIKAEFEKELFVEVKIMGK